MAQKLLVGDKDAVLLIPAYEVNGVPQMALPTTGASIPITGATNALLNYWLDVLTPSNSGSAWGGNVTCSILDDMNLALKDSSTKETRTLCSVGQAQELTYYNYDAVFNFLRDINPQDNTSDFNLAQNLIQAPDIPYVIAHRVGYGRLVDSAVGQEWNFYYAWTDHQIPASSDGDYQALGETMVPKGIINFKYAIAS